MAHSLQNLPVGLDLDGVIIDHTENKLRVARRFGVRLTLQQTASDIMETQIPEERYRKIQWHLYDNPEIALTPPLVSGALAGIEFLKLAEYPYFLISRRKNPEFGITLLKKRGLWPAYFNEENMFFVRDARGKNEKAAGLGIGMYLDDQPSVIAELTDIPKKFLFDPHGSFTSPTAQYPIVNSWQEFLNHLPRES